MKVTQNDIIQFNELYCKYKTYAEVARQTGFSASTVRKYIYADYTPTEELTIVRFKMEDMPLDFDLEQFKIENWGELCALTDEELIKMDELRKEIQI